MCIGFLQVATPMNWFDNRIINSLQFAYICKIVLTLVNNFCQFINQLQALAITIPYVRSAVPLY